jgi:hypothetical protein
VPYAGRTAPVNPKSLSADIERAEAKAELNRGSDFACLNPGIGGIRGLIQARRMYADVGYPITRLPTVSPSDGARSGVAMTGGVALPPPMAAPGGCCADL